MNTTNKKYSDYIDFPVEIVGKDGVVRYYTFEESVSLYQRRIRLARLRYDTPSERKRELEHCSNRIAQLRRSFFARYGWESFKLINRLPQELSIELSGELSAYLRRQFGCGIQKAPAILECLDENEGFWVFSISIQDWQGMMYCSVDPSKIEAISIQFGREPKEDVEFILDTYVVRDFTVLVTSITGSLKPSEKYNVIVDPSINIIYQSISDGDLLQALALCIQLVDKEPYNKQAYWAGLILSEQLRVHSQGLMLAEMALSNFPNEMMFHKRKIESSLRLGEFEVGVRHWDRNVELMTDRNHDLLNVIVSIHRNKYSKALRLLGRVKAQTTKVKASAIWLRKLLLYRTLTNRLVWLSILLWLAFGLWIHIAFVGLVAFSIVALVWMEFGFRKRLQVALSGTGYVQLSLIAQNDVYALNRSLNNAH